MLNHTGFVFPGQGSQAIGMLSDIALQFNEVKETFDQASAVLGYNLWQLVQEGSEGELNQTVHSQPALLAASYAIWRILKVKANNGLNPVMLAGHSLGEYTALVCADSLSFEDGIKLVAARGQYMQEAVPKEAGAMAAIIGLDEATVADICKQAVSTNEILSPANFNSIGQVVVAGHKQAILKAVSLAKAAGAKLAVIIPVSVPSHCKLMEPAAKRLALLLAAIPFAAPSIPVISNVDVTAYQNRQAICDGLIRQLSMPVRWVETIQFFAKAGIKQIIECGPGKVLTGLNKRIDKSMQLLTSADKASLEALLAISQMDQRERNI